MQRVAVTGATSMLGVALVKECIEHGIEVLAIIRRHSLHKDRLPDSELLVVCECNLDSLDDLDTFEKMDRPYDVFYHMAWAYTAKEQRDNPVLQEKNIKYTLDAVRLAKELGCKKFIGAGSQAEYGKVDGIITPDTPVNPLTAYGMAKYAAGVMSKKLCEQCQILHIWGRIFSVYGRYDREGTMINYAIDCFLKGKTAKFSLATQMWDYLYEEDAGKIFFLIGERVSKNQVYCIAKGESRILKEYIMEIKDIFGLAACVFSEEIGGGDIISLQADVEAYVKDIGYQPQCSFRRGIRNLIEYQGGKQSS